MISWFEKSINRLLTFLGFFMTGMMVSAFSILSAISPFPSHFIITMFVVCILWCFAGITGILYIEQEEL